jgi:hypothetical protein
MGEHGVLRFIHGRENAKLPLGLMLYLETLEFWYRRPRTFPPGEKNWLASAPRSGLLIELFE